MTDEHLRALHVLTLQQLGRAALDGERRLQMDLLRFEADLLATPRNADPKRLIRHGAKVYSQNDEDGMIAEILRRIGSGPRTFFEFGVADGLESNTLALLVGGWRGAWAEPDPTRSAGLESVFQPWLQDRSLRLCGTAITPNNVNSVWRSCGLGDELDLLSIDIDGNDLWVWRAFTATRPRIVVIEYNATWAPPLSIAVPFAADWRWDGSNYFGASLTALHAVGAEKGYRLAGCCLAGVNAFFVREDLCEEGRFLSPFTPEEHYEPARYFLAAKQSGHRAGIGRLEDITRASVPAAEGPFEVGWPPGRS